MAIKRSTVGAISLLLVVLSVVSANAAVVAAARPGVQSSGGKPQAMALGSATPLPAQATGGTATNHVAGPGLALVGVGTSHDLEVIAVGRIEDMSSDTLPVIVRNNGTDPLMAISVAIIVRNEDGRVIAAGGASKMSPQRIAPGEYGFGEATLFFSGKGIPSKVELELVANGLPVSGGVAGDIDLDHVSSAYAENGTITGEFTNTASEIATTPTAYVVCLDETGTPTRTAKARLDDRSLDPGELSDFKITIPSKACAYFIIAASG